ncbi:MAG: diguanylate cyclase [Halothiobacillaceae bacterium]
MQPANIQTDLSQWSAVFDAAPPQARAVVRQVVEDESAHLAGVFYERMLDDPQAGEFLSHQSVHERLNPSMQRWLRLLFGVDHVDQLREIIDMQRHVGSVHARVDLPVSLVARGARLLKAEMRRLVQERAPEWALPALYYVNDLMDLALEEMSAAYVQSHAKAARRDEAYRMFSFGQNMSVERERQRAALLDWESRVLYLVMGSEDVVTLPPLAESSFGMWLQHKGMAIFEGSRELAAIEKTMRQVDEQLLPSCQERFVRGETGAARNLIREVQVQAEQIKFYLSTMFERALEIESGKDALTQLLNRRFLPAIMSREIEFSRRSGKAFAVMLLDIDHFKQINDQHGHHAGDRVLQQVSALIVANLRNGDFVFRYGGEEFLVLLVESTAEGALRVAEKIRQLVQSEAFVLADGSALSVTLSMGVALHDGHPDYQRLIARADEALYEAKNAGRNGCVLASSEAAVQCVRDIPERAI